MFGIKKVFKCLENLSMQVQGIHASIQEMDSRIQKVEFGIQEMDSRIQEMDARLSSRLDAHDARFDILEEKINMAEYHLSKEIEVTYQAVLENKANIETLENQFKERNSVAHQRFSSASRSSAGLKLPHL